VSASTYTAHRPAALVPIIAATLWIALLAALGDGRDFRTFLESVIAWRSEDTLYPRIDYPNLNLPHASLLFLPLADLPWGAALTVWQTAQVLCAFRVFWLLPGLPPWAWILIAVAQPTVTGTMIGQVAWLMAWLVSEAAYAARRGLPGPPSG
jgi:hypothetical protein